ncbi:hypothetical protein PENANT_c020G10577 [Penicillium antarcticum]|uniref:Uncharacterized protein n=1 Tax=Penicillium antarcticum TaxID=416450 RepID=A0A1V6Q1M8_9EURO|nr:hypothetical protein PENANT_c020G10577 [Penicillium antarcticum]
MGPGASARVRMSCQSRRDSVKSARDIDSEIATAIVAADCQKYEVHEPCIMSAVKSLYRCPISSAVSINQPNERPQNQDAVYRFQYWRHQYKRTHKYKDGAWTIA